MISSCFIQSSPTYAGYQKFANTMSTGVKKIKESMNMQRPNFKTTEEPDRYQPVTPFDFKEYQESIMKQEENKRMKDDKLLMWKWHVRLNHLSFLKNT